MALLFPINICNDKKLLFKKDHVLQIIKDNYSKHQGIVESIVPQSQAGSGENYETLLLSYLFPDHPEDKDYDLKKSCKLRIEALLENQIKKLLSNKQIFVAAFTDSKSSDEDYVTDEKNSEENLTKILTKLGGQSSKKEFDKFAKFLGIEVDRKSIADLLNFLEEGNKNLFRILKNVAGIERSEELQSTVELDIEGEISGVKFNKFLQELVPIYSARRDIRSIFDYDSKNISDDFARDVENKQVEDKDYLDGKEFVKNELVDIPLPSSFLIADEFAGNTLIQEIETDPITGNTYLKGQKLHLLNENEPVFVSKEIAEDVNNFEKAILKKITTPGSNADILTQTSIPIYIVYSCQQRKKRNLLKEFEKKYETKLRGINEETSGKRGRIEEEEKEKEKLESNNKSKEEVNGELYYTFLRDEWTKIKGEWDKFKHDNPANQLDEMSGPPDDVSTIDEKIYRINLNINWIKIAAIMFIIHFILLYLF